MRNGASRVTAVGTPHTDGWFWTALLVTSFTVADGVFRDPVRESASNGDIRSDAVSRGARPHTWSAHIPLCCSNMIAARAVNTSGRTVKSPIPVGSTPKTTQTTGFAQIAYNSNETVMTSSVRVNRFGSAR